MKTQRLIPQSKLICGDCKHFCQHYGRDERGYYPSPAATAPSPG